MGSCKEGLDLLLSNFLRILGIFLVSFESVLQKKNCNLSNINEMRFFSAVKRVTLLSMMFAIIMLIKVP